jgi:hypothetical protein
MLVVTPRNAVANRLHPVKAVFYCIFVECLVQPVKQMRVNRRKGSGVQLALLISDVDQVFDILEDLVMTRCVTRAVLSKKGPL